MKKIPIFILSLFLLLCISINFFDKKKESIIVSYGNIDDSCTTKTVSLSEKQIIKKYNKFDYVKIDRITNKEKITIDNLNKLIRETSKNSFNYGLYFSDYNFSLLSEEINSNNIIDFDNFKININNLNSYLKKKNLKINITTLSNIELFSTESKLLENNKFIKLYPFNGFNLKKYEKNEIFDIIKNSANRLISMINYDGSYIYGIRTNSHTIINSYNILRHAGSTYSLIKYYAINPSEELKAKIENAINYLLNNFTMEINDKLYVIEKKTSEIKLGGNALALLMLSEYQKVFESDKYLPYSLKIANAIMSMQNNDGSYNHVLNLDLSIKETYRTVFYDGEATFALINLYDINKDEKLYNAAKRAIDYFIDHNYLKYRDHWQSYAINSFLRYNNEKKYSDYALNNYLYNKSSFEVNKKFSPILLELLLQTNNSYILCTEESKKDFNIESLNDIIEKNKNTLLTYYIDKSVAMYFNNPGKVIYGFHNINNNFRMRIDDIQHSLLGLIEYYKNTKK